LQKDSKNRPAVATRRQRSQQTFTTKPTNKTAARLKPANCNRQQQFEHSKPTKFKPKISVKDLITNNKGTPKQTKTVQHRREILVEIKKLTTPQHSLTD